MGKGGCLKRVGGSRPETVDWGSRYDRCGACCRGSDYVLLSMSLRAKILRYLVDYYHGSNPCSPYTDGYTIIAV